MPVFNMEFINVLRSIQPASGVRYMGPETIMPVATLLATIVGFLLIFWRLIVRLVKKLFWWIFKRGTGASTNTVTPDTTKTQENV
jgi:hypothetical protein